VHFPAGLIAFAFIVTPVLSAPADNLPLSVQVFVNDNKTPLQSGPEVTIPYDASQVRFLIVPAPGIVRYRLTETNNWQKRINRLFSGENLLTQSQNWQTRGGAMFVGIRFVKANGDFIGETRFLANGKSPGWKGSPESSTFTPRKEFIQAPDEPCSAEIFMTSAGPPASVGLFAVTNCNLIQDGSPLNFKERWSRQGTRPSMASIENINGHTAFVIDDNDIRSHADWVSPAKPIKPHDTITLQWDELYSNGMGDPLTAVYGTLPVGEYQFTTEAVDLAGKTKHQYTVNIHIPPPFWRTTWFWGTCLAATTILGGAGGLLWSRAVLRQREEKQRLIEQERRRIARDLHDDLGAQLSQIILTSSHATASAPDDRSQQTFRSITALAHNVSTSLSKTIWMLNSENDNLESLVDFLTRMLVSQCKSSGVRSRTDIPELSENVMVSNDFRHNVSLAVREAISNALRHANASEIWLRTRFEKGRLEIDITDNGRGLPTTPSMGNGLANMKQRAEAYKGLCELSPQPDGGTRVHFEFYVTPPGNPRDSAWLHEKESRPR
jgi:signal transduction histidine kinase